MNQYSTIFAAIILLFAAIFAYGSADDSEQLVVFYFYDEQCPNCKKVSPLMSELQEKYPEVEFRKYDVLGDSSNYSLFLEACFKVNVSTPAVPLVIAGDESLLGYMEIEQGLEDTIIKYLESGAVNSLLLGFDPSGYQPGSEPLIVYYFYYHGCCRDTNELIHDLILKYNEVFFMPIMVDSENGMANYNYVLSVINQQEPELPMAIVGNSGFKGNVSIKSNLENTIISYLDREHANVLLYDSKTAKIFVRNSGLNSDNGDEKSSNSKELTNNNSPGGTSAGSLDYKVIGILAVAVLLLLILSTRWKRAR